MLIARHQKGQKAGYIWVGQAESTFTGKHQAFIINLYVALEFRGQGIGSALMGKAEEWAHLHNLDRIGLRHSVQNRVVVTLRKSGLYSRDNADVQTHFLGRLY